MVQNMNQEISIGQYFDTEPMRKKIEQGLTNRLTTVDVKKLRERSFSDAIEQSDFYKNIGGSGIFPSVNPEFYKNYYQE